MKKYILYFLLVTCLTPLIGGQQKDAIKNIKTLILEVKEIYPDIKEDFSLSLEGKVSQFLSGMGMTIVPVGETCDANFKVLFTGKAGKLEFTSGSGKLMNCYAQADYKIEMTLALTETGGNFRSESIDNFTSRLITEDNCSQDAKKAPFDQAWQGGFLSALSKLWPSSKVYMNALETEDRRFHIPAVSFYLSNKPVPEAIPGLMRLLKSASEEKRQSAIRVGDSIVNPQSSWDLTYIQLNGPFAFDKFGPEDAGAVPYLCKFLQDSSVSIRATSARALGRIGPKAVEGVPDLCKFLQDSSASVRATGAEVLGQIGPAAIDAVPFLINALKESVNKGDRDKIYVDALKKITKQNLGKQSDRWQQWWEGYREKFKK